MADDYDGLMDSHFAGPDAAIRNFYDKLSDMSSTWYPLQSPDGDYAYYRISELGDLALGQLTNLFADWPTLDYFHFTQARNGGPIGKSLAIYKWHWLSDCVCVCAVCSTDDEGQYIAGAEWKEQGVHF